MTRLDTCFGRRSGQVLDGEALASLLRRYSIGQAEQAAVRAFGRIVPLDDLADDLLERLNLDEEEAVEGAVSLLLRMMLTP